MTIPKKRRGNSIAFGVPQELSTPACIALKRSMMDTLMDRIYDVSLDMSQVSSIDTSGIRFLENVSKQLEKNQRKLILFETREPVHGALVEAGVNRSCKVFQTLEEFEKTFHEMPEESRRGYFKLSLGEGPIRRIRLCCPICETEDINGFMLDETKHVLAWEENEITPQWHVLQDADNELPFDLYEVAVCPNCFFASARLDHFSLLVDEGVIGTVLNPDQLERLARNNGARDAMISEGYKENARAFFGMPREGVAAYHSWALYDRCLRDANKERLSVDALEVARANIMMAKFSDKSNAMDKFFSTAHVWLTDIVKQPDKYSTLRLVATYVFLLSVDLGLDKDNEAKKLYQKFVELFGDDMKYRFWLERAGHLMESVDD